eukprot:CAMPEP_0115227026 /NCGR_PEP_ID=MMETSP0270-20121206/30931_1 /TAXON_ID=71861 /ORGANISM="Scrippsiella trochoidea, Strain CCMP3099" /LENGTH=171 /DNA_ID=CAMNT_0002641461 /DNA_START=526 /DNA_END=1038 /DNA_ORIENTATION=+
MQQLLLPMSCITNNSHCTPSCNRTQSSCNRAQDARRRPKVTLLDIVEGRPKDPIHPTQRLSPSRAGGAGGLQSAAPGIEAEEIATSAGGKALRRRARATLEVARVGGILEFALRQAMREDSFSIDVGGESMSPTSSHLHARVTVAGVLEAGQDPPGTGGGIAGSSSSSSST